MGNDANNERDRQPQQQQDNTQRQQPGQQQQQGGQDNRAGQQQNQADKGGQQGGRIDTDGDGRTRDPNDKSPTDNGGRG